MSDTPGMTLLSLCVVAVAVTLAVAACADPDRETLSPVALTPANDVCIWPYAGYSGMPVNEKEEEVIANVAGAVGVATLTARDTPTQQNQPSYLWNSGNSSVIEENTLAPFSCTMPGGGHYNNGADFGWYGVGAAGNQQCPSTQNDPERHRSPNGTFAAHLETHCIKAGQFNLSVNLASGALSRPFDFLRYIALPPGSDIRNTSQYFLVETPFAVGQEGLNNDVVINYETVTGATATPLVEISSASSGTYQSQAWTPLALTSGRYQVASTDYVRLGAWLSSNLSASAMVRYFWNYGVDNTDRSGFVNVNNNLSGNAIIRVRMLAPGAPTILAHIVQPWEWPASGQADDATNYGHTVSLPMRVIGPPKYITITGGNNLSATVGQATATPPKVTVTDAGTNPLAGIPVTFAVTGGGGSVSPAPAVTTNSLGIATATSWTLGTVAGPNGNGLSATVSPTIAVSFTATGVAGAATTISKVAGDNQTGRISASVPVAPSVKVADAYGNGVTGRTVTFAVASGGGTLNPATVVTSSAGLATLTSWTLGPAVGTNTATASSAGLTPASLTFTAQGVLVVPPTNFLVTGCSVSTVAGKQYATYSTAWTAGAGNLGGTTSEVGYSFSSSSSTASVIWSGLTGTTQALGPYLLASASTPRYFWVRHKNGTTVSTWAPLDLFPIPFTSGCMA